jgi:transposase
MSEITTIGLDLAKHVFQVHGIDASGTTVLRKRLRRGHVLAFFSRLPRCVVGVEACATAHYWARELGAFGHEDSRAASGSAVASWPRAAAQGLRNVGQLISIIRDGRDLRLPEAARQVLQVLAAQLEHIEAAIAALEKQLMAWHKTNAVSQRLASILSGHTVS